MTTIEFALVRFGAITAAEKAFADARNRSAPDAPWIHLIGLVEHHHNGHWVLRGTFAGHYVDVDEALHVSEHGGVEGFAAGAALGALLGPPGLAAGMVLGAIIGSQTAHPSEHDSEPRLLDEQLRNRLPRAGSAIALIGQPTDVDALLAALGETDGTVLRQPLSQTDLDSLTAHLRLGLTGVTRAIGRGRTSCRAIGQLPPVSRLTSFDTTPINQLREETP